MSHQFATLSEAEEALQVDYINNDIPPDFGAVHQTSSPQRPATAIPDNTLSPNFLCSITKCVQPLTSSVGDLVQEFILNFKNCMSCRLCTQPLDHLLKITIVDSKGLDFYKFVNKDFLSSSLSGMKKLFMNSKQNLIFYLSEYFEGPSPRMPINQMPYGLLNYNIHFFAEGQVALEGNFRFLQDKSDLKSASDNKFVRKATVAVENKICEQNTTQCCERLAISR